MYGQRAVGDRRHHGRQCADPFRKIQHFAVHEVHTKANIEYPSYRSCENRNGSTVNFGNILRRNEETTNQKYAYND